MASERSTVIHRVRALRAVTVFMALWIFIGVAGLSASADSRDSKKQALPVTSQKANPEATAFLTGTFSSLPSATRPKADLVNLPLNFEPNQGQTDPRVQFLSRGSGYSLFLTADEVILNLERQSLEAISSAPDNKPTAAQVASMHMKLIGASASAKAAGVDQQPGVVNYLVGNDPSKWRTGVPTYAKVRYSQLYPGVNLVFYGNQRRLEYDFVVAPGAAPEQIVMEFSGAKPSISSDGDLQLVLDGAPVTMLKPVAYQSNGAQKQSVDGRYLLTGNRVRFQLGAYDHSRALVIDPQIVYLTYLGGSTWDSIGCDTAFINGCVNTGFPNQSLAVDGSGNVYVTGFTESTDFPVQNAFQPTPKRLSGYYNAYVTKLNASGSAAVYSTYLGGSIFDMGYSIAVDAKGSAYVAGWTISPDFPTTAGSYMPVCPYYTYYNGYPLSSPVSYCQYYGSTMGFLTKLSPDGQSLAYSTYLGTGAGNSNIVSVAVDTNGKAYVAGNTTAHCDSSSEPIPWDEPPCFPETANALQPEAMWDRTSTPGAVNQGSAFVSVFDAAGANLLYSTLYGDSNGPVDYNVGADFAVNATGVAVDAGGNFYLTGYTRNANVPMTTGAFQPKLQVPTSVLQPRGFVAKFSPVSATGGPTLLYGTYFGGTSTTNQGGEQIIGMVADASGSAYLAGLTQSPDFPVTPGANNIGPCTTNSSALYCSNTAFLTKLKPDGSGLAWSTFVGYPYQGGTSGGVLLITPPRLDSKGNVYVEGMSSAGYPQVNGLQASPGGNPQVFVTKYDPTGSTVFFSSFVGDGGATGYTATPAAMDVDPQGNIYVGGNTYSPYMPTTAGAIQTKASNISGMGFLARIDPFVTTTTALAIVPTTAGVGQTVTFTATVYTNQNGTASGTVNFLNGTTLLGTGTLDGNGVATFSTSELPAGAYSVTAAYLGDGTFAPSTSSAQSLPINSGSAGQEPTISSLSPSSAAAGGAAFTLTVNGTNFVSGATVNWGSTALATTFVSASQLTAAVPAGLIATVGVASVTVTTSGDTSNPLAFTVQGALLFVPMTPCRVVDTRNATRAFGGPSITGGTSRSFVIPNSACAVPSTVTAYSLNVTVVPKAGLGYLTVWPTGVAQPVVSTLNSDGRVKANAAIVPAGTGGAISVYATDTTDLVLDINGYFVPATSTTALAFYPLTPCRVADTRNPSGPSGGPSLTSMQARAFSIQSSACNIPSSAQAYSLNFTAVPQAGLGYLSAWPTGQAWPGVSTLNVSPNNPVVANAAIVPAGTNGEINVLGSDNTDVVIDINGYFAPPGSAAGGQALFTMTPCRVLDTRNSGGLMNGMLTVNMTSSSCGIPSSAEAFVLNATVVPTGGLGYLTLWPENEVQPVVSTLNADDGVIASNMAIVPTTNGSIDAFSSSATQLILDISGYFAPSSSGVVP